MHYNNKHYVFHEDGNEYIPLKITLLDVPGYYNIFEGDSKRMNFKLDNNSLRKIIDIFDPYHYSYDDNNGITYFKTKVSDEHVLEKAKITQLIQFQIKRLSIIVEYYYKYNLFTTIMMKIYLKMKIVILKYFYEIVDIPFLSIIN